MLPLGGSYLYLYCRPIAFRSERSLSGHDGEKLDFICSTLVSWPLDFLGSSIRFGRLYIMIRSERCISAPASQRMTRKERYAWCSSRFACSILIDFFVGLVEFRRRSGRSSVVRHGMSCIDVAIRCLQLQPPSWSSANVWRLPKLPPPSTSATLRHLPPPWNIESTSSPIPLHACVYKYVYLIPS